MRSNYQLLSEYVKHDLEKYKYYESFRNVTNDSYAKEHGISRTVLYEILAGKHDAPQPFFAVRLCKIFDLDPDEILDMITNVNDDFIDKFLKLYNGTSFEDECKSAIQYFFNKNTNFNLYCEEEQECDLDGSINNYSLDSLVFKNISEETKYTPGICNATCRCDIFDIKQMIDGCKDMYEYLPFFYSHWSCGYNFDIYYLSNTRVRKNSVKTYKDEIYRDFSNKLLYLLTNEDVTYNNVFLTTSKKLFDKINHDFGEIKVKPDNGVGIALVYCRQARAQEVSVILENDDMIQGPVFGY